MFVLVIGVHSKSFHLLWLGRFIYGTAGESMVALSIAMFAEYFLPEELGLATGIYFLLSHMGNLLTLTVSPYVGKKYGLTTAYDLGIVASFIGLIFRISLNCVDSYNNKMKKLHNESNEAKEEEAPTTPLNLKNGCRVFWRVFFQKFGKEFWVVTFYSITTFNSIYMVLTMGKTYLVKEFFDDLPEGEKDQNTDSVFFIFQITVMAGNLTFGYISYKFKTFRWGYLPSPLLMITGVSLLMMRFKPSLCFMLLGLGVSTFYSNFWANLMITIDPNDRVRFRSAWAGILKEFFSEEIGICFWNPSFR